jgi:S-ribosylhomocysteine lyase
MRERLDGIIDLSPKGGRTGFYLTVWGNVDSQTVKDALLYSLKGVVDTEWDEVPGTTAKECDNYRDHSLFGAKEYAKQVIEGFEEK